MLLCNTQDNRDDCKDVSQTRKNLLLLLLVVFVLFSWLVGYDQLKLGQGHVKLLSKKVRFSHLLQQHVTWRLPEWSALWSRQVLEKFVSKVHYSAAGVCMFTRWWTEQTVNRKCMFYFVILRSMSINCLHLCSRLLCRLLHCCFAANY